jgi:Fe-Mn family superoxide dismutase
METKRLLVKYAREPSRAMLFNYASMAHNNHFFFRSLSNKPAQMSPYMKDQVEKAFGSVENLRKSMTAYANAMFGPGFTWLVAPKGPLTYNADTPRLAILNTYLAGSPYPQAHYRLQPADQNTSQDGVMGSTSPSVYAEQQRDAGRTPLGLHGRKKMLAPGGQDLEPLLCVSTWEHVWLYDHGIGGKQKYLESWWDNIHWSQVESMWSDAKSMKSTFDARQAAGGR